MKKLVTLCLFATLLLALAAPAGAVKNANGKWALHYAGVHNAKANTCDLTIVDCAGIVTEAPGTAGRYDVYVVAVDVVGISGIRYGVACAGPFFFYGWTKCSDFEIPTTGWPGCGEANAQTWTSEQLGPHVTVGILDTYHYGGLAVLKMDSDARVGFAEFCDGSEPSPICYQTTDNTRFGCVGFDCAGYNPCSEVPVEQRSWGQVKAIYR
jgi:hypothetical protein